MCIVLIESLVAFIVVKKYKSHNEAQNTKISEKVTNIYIYELCQNDDIDISDIEDSSDLFDYYIDDDKYHPKTAFLLI